jgi:UDP-N-acetylmuramoylalanine--D-glutamate ligase
VGTIAASVVPVSCSRELERGIFVRGGAIVSRLGGMEREVVAASDLLIPGPHNLSNAIAAVAAALLVGVGVDEAARVLKAFEPLEHRMERVAEIDGVQYVNDSKATNVESVRYALESYDAPIVLIAGGPDKGSGFSGLGESVEAGVRHVVLIGDAAASIERALAGLTTIERAASLRDAVRAAARIAVPGDVVLLSPACASFDMFKDFEDRGRQFKALVSELTTSGGPRAERE